MRLAAALALCMAGVAVAMLITAARGDGISGAVSPQSGGGITQFDGGISASLTPPTPVAGCTNQLVLVYSNSCALIGQGWGE